MSDPERQMSARMHRLWYWCGEHIPWVLRAFCIRGHRPVSDMCLNPAHDYCWACGARTPGRAVSEPRKP